MEIKKKNTESVCTTELFNTNMMENLPYIIKEQVIYYSEFVWFL